MRVREKGIGAAGASRKEGLCGQLSIRLLWSQRNPSWKQDLPFCFHSWECQTVTAHPTAPGACFKIQMRTRTAIPPRC